MRLLALLIFICPLFASGELVNYDGAEIAGCTALNGFPQQVSIKGSENICFYRAKCIYTLNGAPKLNVLNIHCKAANPSQCPSPTDCAKRKDATTNSVSAERESIPEKISLTLEQYEYKEKISKKQQPQVTQR